MKSFADFTLHPPKPTLWGMESEIGPSSFEKIHFLVYNKKTPQLLIENWGAADALKNAIKLPFRVH
ncbi:MAG: hypothetical protein WCL57_10135, partial [Chloroflexota bacterium]|jgi:hypothetical protein